MIRTTTGSKSRSRTLIARLFLAGAMVLVLSAAAVSVEPIKVIVPIPPGASLDLMARVLADEIGRTRGQTMIVENKPGAGTIVGTEAASRAAPDGHTLVMVGTGFVISPVLHKTHYDPLISFAPICQLFDSPMVIAVSAKSPYRSLAELLNAARAKPGQLTLASIGPGSTAHLALEQLKRAAKVDMIFVPYPGTTPAFSAVLGGQVTAYLGESSFVVAQTQAGTLRALAVAWPKRLETLPDVPTLTELGFAGVKDELWWGVLAPANTPASMIGQLAGSYSAALQAPNVKTKLHELGLYATLRCGNEFATFLRAQFEDDSRIIREIGISMQ